MEGPPWRPLHTPLHETDSPTSGGIFDVREEFEAGLDPLFHHHYRKGEASSDYEPTQQPVQRQTTLVLNCCNPGTDPSLRPTQGAAQNGCRFWGQKQAPETMSPHSWGTSFRGPKMVCKSGPLFGAPKKRPPCRNPSIPVVSVDTEPPFAGGARILFPIL